MKLETIEHVFSIGRSNRPARRQTRPWTPARVVGGIRRYGAAALTDCVAVAATYILAIAVRTGGRPEIFEPDLAPYALAAALGAGVLQVLTNLLFDVYWRDWTAAAIEDLVALAKSTSLVVLTLLGFNLATESHWIPTGAVLAGGSLTLVVEAALHLRPRWPRIISAALGRAPAAENVVVVGAGRLGQLLASDIASGGRDYRIACFVDDDARKTGSYVRGVRVAGRLSDLAELIDWYGASSVVIAIANPPGALMRRVVDMCEGKDVRIRRLSGFALLRGDTTPLRQIGIEELLAREPVDLLASGTSEQYRGRSILITGAAGSIGSELARQVLRLSPSRIYLLDSNESGLHAVHQSLGGSPIAEIVLGDIRDREWMRHIVGRLRPQVVFHAAAYKHVPILESSPLPGVSTNVLGTASVLQACDSIRVERFVFVSTDKAVEPTSVLGLTKRFGELLTLAYANDREANCAVVRFGNVLGSVGSAVPIFTRQIDLGGPVTVTHAEATRYFMTIEEAAGLLLVAGSLASPSDLLVLDMGDPVRIGDLAERMIRLRGLRTPADIEIKYTGLRPGEKLHEQLFAADERASGTEHPRVMRVASATSGPSLATLEDALRAIANRTEAHDVEGALDLVTAVVKGAAPIAPSRVESV